MKRLFFISLFFTSIHCFATKYYVSLAGSNSNSGASPRASWKTVDKVNGFTFKKGDSILFKRGDLWSEQLVPPRDNIYFGAYGTGSKPIISGFTTLTNWVNDGNGIWHSNVPSASEDLIVVTINGNLQRIGRYPNANTSNAGYFTNTGIDTNTRGITGPALSTTTKWTGAEIVVRKNHWIIDRCLVTFDSADIINYTNPKGSSYVPDSGYGYFFQNDIRTLDQFGEWFLNRSTKSLSVFFGEKNPSSFSIKASVVDTLVNVGGHNNITFGNIAFEGANKLAVSSRFGARVVVENCSFNNNYNAISLVGITSLQVINNTIINTLNNGVLISDNASAYQNIQYNTFKNTALFAGMSGSGDGNASAIAQNGAHAHIEYNTIDSSGYIPIVFVGYIDTIRYNYITNYNITKDDGGGIYTVSRNVSAFGNDVSYNIIDNGIGAREGTPNYIKPGSTYDTHGIYLDEESNHVNVHNNSISNCADGSGIFINLGKDNVITNNNIYNVRVGLTVTRMPDRNLIRNITFTSNVVYANVSNFLYWNGSLNTPNTVPIQSDIIALFKKIDNNYYRNDIAAPFNWIYHLTNGGTFVAPESINFSRWQKYIGAEGHSYVLPVVPELYKTNPTAKSVVYDLGGYNYFEAIGTKYANTLTLQPYTSKILFRGTKF